MTIHEAGKQLLFQLYHLYDEREAAAITDLVMEAITDWKKIDRILNKQVPLSMPQETLLKKYAVELLSHKPVQYVLGEAWFYGMKFYVDEHVLIPRPETEELVEWIIKENQNLSGSLLDIGSGSGCIPIALKKKLPAATVYSCDTSKEALTVSTQNAAANNTDIQFIALDFLDAAAREQLPSFDIIVSNPPYIPLRDKAGMRQNVIAFEPHLALFVSDNNPLIFYEAIADFAKQHLNAHGKIYVEIHEELHAGAKQLFSFKGFSGIEIKKDLQGKNRMLKATMLL